MDKNLNTLFFDKQRQGSGFLSIFSMTSVHYAVLKKH